MIPQYENGVPFGPRIPESSIVWNHGHEFIAKDVQYYPDKENPGFELMRYTGECTAHTCNDSIRNTGYNGGTYGYRVKAEPKVTHNSDPHQFAGGEWC